MEYLDVVDDKDSVVGKASIDEIYEKRLPHRIVHILIFNDKDELALQMRSKHKSFCPHHWSTPVGGHVQSGESYEQAALREYEEELGTTSAIDLAFRDVYKDSRGFTKFLSIFNAKFNGPFEVNPEEVDFVEYFSLDKVKDMIRSGEKFHPELLFLLKKHLKVE